MRSPVHIAIIMDGNGRWGLKNYNKRINGHQHGVKNIKPIINFCLTNNVKNLTLFTLSFDNLLNRKKSEISNLFLLLENYLFENLDYFQQNKIRLNFIGEKKNIPFKIKNLIKKTSERTKKYKSKIVINLAFNYSSRLEIIYSIKKINNLNKKFNIKNINKYLYTRGVSDPEIIIRTGGYRRLSDFLLWQSSYSELFFSKKLWPDFKVFDLKKILKEYHLIKRNFGS